MKRALMVIDVQNEYFTGAFDDQCRSQHRGMDRSCHGANQS